MEGRRDVLVWVCCRGSQFGLSSIFHIFLQVIVKYLSFIKNPELEKKILQVNPKKTK